MPIEFDIHPESHYVEAHWVGLLSQKDVFDGYDAFFRSGDWRPLWPEPEPVWLELANLSSQEPAFFGDNWVHQQADFFQRHYRSEGFSAARVATYAPQDLHYGLSRVYQQRSEGSLPETMQVFRDRAQAIDWLLNPPKE